MYVNIKKLSLITLLLLAISLNATNLDNVIEILGYVESANNHPLFQVGDNGKAIGYLQLHKVYVDDANRISRCEIFKYSDRLDKQKSISIAKVVLKHYMASYKRDKGKGCNIYQVGYIHNLGGSWRRDNEFNERHKKSYIKKMKLAMITRIKERRI